jgi:hypothetical protein
VRQRVSHRSILRFYTPHIPIHTHPLYHYNTHTNNTTNTTINNTINNNTNNSHRYWLDIEPSYVEAARKKGKMDDRVELNMIEKKMAYGCSASPKPGEEGTFIVKLVAFPSRLVTVKLEDGKPVARMSINGEDHQLKKIYVTATERTLRLPKVEHIDLFAVDKDGKAVTERQKGE